MQKEVSEKVLHARLLIGCAKKAPYRHGQKFSPFLGLKSVFGNLQSLLLLGGENTYLFRCLQ